MKRLSYDRIDFEGFRTQLENYLKATGKWSDIYESSIAQLLIDIPSFVGDALGYEIMRSLQESFLGTARRRESIVNMVKLVGYEPARKVSSTTVIRVSGSTRTHQVIIPKWTEFEASSLKFVTTEEAVWDQGATYIDLIVKQGELIIVNKVGTGEGGQYVDLPDNDEDSMEGVENSSIEVWIAGAKWAEVDTLYGQDMDTKVYEAQRQTDKMRILFGDAINGAVVPDTAAIVVYYLKSDGVAGNIYTYGSVVWTLNDSIYDGTTDIKGNVTIAQQQAATGGEDEETLEEIRATAPLTFSAGDRAVTIADYRGFLLNYSGVLKANAWGEQEELGGGSSNPDHAWAIILCVVPTDGSELTVVQKAAIETYLEDKKVVGTEIQWEDPQYVFVDANIRATVTQASEADTVKTTIEGIVEDLFGLGDKDLGEALRLGDLYEKVEGTDGVSHCEVELNVDLPLGLGDGAETGFAATAAALPIVESTCLIWVNDHVVGQDDGAGAIAGVDITSGTIDYDTGEITILFDNPVTNKHWVRATYKMGVEEELVIDQKSTNTAFALLKTRVKIGSAVVTADGTTVLTDDGAGTLVEVDGSGYSGTIDYTTGRLFIDGGATALTSLYVVVNYNAGTGDISAERDELIVGSPYVVSSGDLYDATNPYAPRLVVEIKRITGG